MAGEHSEDFICEGCGMGYAAYRDLALVEAPTDFIERWRRLTADASSDELAERPAEGVWSANEYAGHLVDVLGWMSDTLDRMRTEDEPAIGWFDHEAAVDEHGYAGWARDELTAALTERSHELAGALARVEEDQWGRTAEFVWGERDILDMARNAVHEGVHHLTDVERGLESIRLGEQPAG